MQEYTSGEGCGDEGDYLSWDDMEWTLHGDATFEHIDAEEPCTTQTLNFYNAEFHEMQSCMH